MSNLRFKAKKVKFEIKAKKVIIQIMVMGEVIKVNR